jgi:hypothetical protein
MAFEREFLLEDLRNAGGAVLDGGPLTGWGEAVRDRDEHDVVEALWASPAPGRVARLSCGLWSVIRVVFAVPALPVEHATEFLEFALDALLIDLLPGCLALGGVSIVLKCLLVLLRRQCVLLSAAVSWTRRRLVRCWVIDIASATVYWSVLTGKLRIARPVTPVVSLGGLGYRQSRLKRIERCLLRAFILVGIGTTVLGTRHGRVFASGSRILPVFASSLGSRRECLRSRRVIIEPLLRLNG